MENKKFTLYMDVLCVLDELTDKQAGCLFKAIKAYQEGTPYEHLLIDSITNVAFTSFKVLFDRGDEK